MSVEKTRAEAGIEGFEVGQRVQIGPHIRDYSWVAEMEGKEFDLVDGICPSQDGEIVSIDEAGIAQAKCGECDYWTTKVPQD